MSDGRLVRVGDDFAREYPGANALASECYVNLVPGVHQLESNVMSALTHTERTTLLGLRAKIHR